MPKRRPSVLFVDRPGDHTRELVAFLRRNEFEVVWVRDGESAFNVLERTRVDCMISALRAPRIEGSALLERARRLHPEICVVLMSGAAENAAAAEATHHGACDVLARPVLRRKLLAVFQRALAHQRVVARLADAEARLDRRFGTEFLDGRSAAIRRVMEQVRHLAATRGPVLIEGESGTGRARVAQAIHHNGVRRDRPFVWVDCASASEHVLEGEIFGEEAREDSATSPRRGLLEIADGGSLLLEEMAEVSPAVQVRLLRFLQDRGFERVGGNHTLRADVRLLVSTRRNLAEEVRHGTFREDLAERLGVAHVRMPALRDRREDLPMLVDALIAGLKRTPGRRVTGVTRGVIDRFMEHSWPENLDELGSVLEGMAVSVVGRRPLDLPDLPERLRAGATADGRIEISVGTTLEGAERALIAATLDHTGNDKARTAAILGMGLRTLYRKLKHYSIR